MALAALGLLVALPVLAQWPPRNLTVELRQVEEVDRGAYTASTQADAALMLAQQVQVRNGEKASLRVGQLMPMQWVKSASAQSATLVAGEESASSASGGVSYGLTWLQAGQSIQVQPRWPGSKQPVSVAIEVQSAAVAPRVGADLPNQSHHQLATTVSVALGQWVTIAASGQPTQAGVYSSDAGSEPRRLLQIRVLAP